VTVAQAGWPGGKKVALLITVAVELWSPGHRPSYAPMATGWPLPPAEDTHSESWAEYGVTTGAWRLLDILRAHRLPAAFGISGLVADRFPDVVQAVHEAGHEIAAHSYAQDVIAAQLDPEAERDNILRCTEMLTALTGTRPAGWMSPRATGSAHTPELLAEAGYTWMRDRNDHDLPQVISTASGPLVSIMHSDLSDVRSAPNGPRAYRDVHQDLLDHLLSGPGPAVFPLTVHAHVGGRPYLAGMVGQILDHIVRAGDDVWPATHQQVAEHVLRHSA
jgi:peptidoglycan/xylan/chitin deacetylase (PgdA/CDA1 family)